MNIVFAYKTIDKAQYSEEQGHPQPSWIIMASSEACTYGGDEVIAA
jgi:hypothetical protein